jgi:hypothetical protein
MKRSALRLVKVKLALLEFILSFFDAGAVTVAAARCTVQNGRRLWCVHCFTSLNVVPHQVHMVRITAYTYITTYQLVLSPALFFRTVTHHYSQIPCYFAYLPKENNVAGSSITGPTRCTICVCVCVCVCVWCSTVYGNFLYWELSAPVSTGNTFQDLPRLRETADNTERYT